jgi:putative peptide zinc metalloprotease protein
VSGAVEGSAKIVMHELRMRAEQRDGEPEWVIGRVDTGEFVAVPQVAADVVRLLGEGLTVAEVHDHLRREQGRDVDVADFVTALVELGFVRSIGGADLTDTPAARPALPWLRPAHVRWLLTWPTAAAAAAVLVATVAVLAVRPHLLPAGYHDLLWTRHTTLVLVGNAVIAWCIVALHEAAHLLTARSEGVTGRISFGTRLQFLVVQTDISGIWAASRGRRIAVYLAGIAVNVLVAAVAILVRAMIGPDSPGGRAAAATAMLALLFLPAQLLLFVRTDLYFVLQDLTGCRNLYADGSAYVRFLVRATGRKITGSARPPTNPLPALPGRERTAVRCYTVVLVIGTVACLAVAALVTVPFSLSVLTRAVSGMAGTGGAGVADAVLTGTLGAGYWILWGVAWWRRHGARVAGWLRQVTSRAGTQAGVEGR